MSRIGKLPVGLPDKVEVKVSGTQISVKGPNGQLEYTFSDNVKIELKDKEVTVTPINESKKAISMWGTARTLINNMVTGVTTGWTKTLEFNGVGFSRRITRRSLSDLSRFSTFQSNNDSRSLGHEVPPLKFYISAREITPNSLR